MANIKSAMKRAKQADKKRVANQAYKASMRTAMKNVEKAVEDKDLSTAETALVNAEALLDKASSKNLVHKNYAGRNKSRMASLVNSIR